MQAIVAATAAYEAWLGQFIPLLPQDLALKHSKMAADAFAFFRATYYRWAAQWQAGSTDIRQAPEVLAVGDIHLENYGTWRDAEGRLVWGINDLDEVCTLPYTQDLLRLAASAFISKQVGAIGLHRTEICKALLDGYQQGIAHPEPFVLAEQHGWLRRLALQNLKEPELYWQKLQNCPTIAQPDAAAVQLLQQALPAGARPVQVLHRQAGLGSLGRRRLTLLATQQGGLLAREAKEMAPAAWYLAAGQQPPTPAVQGQLLNSHAVRCTDPYYTFTAQWTVRRLAPDCTRIELNTMPQASNQAQLLQAMGQELGNLHAGTPQQLAAISKDLQQREQQNPSWLKEGTQLLVDATLQDFNAWQAHNNKA